MSKLRDLENIQKSFGISPLKSQFPPRRKVVLVCPETSITDQDTARELSMASIRKKLEQGIMYPTTNDLFYSNEPMKFTNLQDTLDFHQQITQGFEQLPAGLRKLMGNDINNLQNFITDPANQETLAEYGLLQKQRDGISEIVDAIKTKPLSDPQTPSDSNKK